LFRERLGFQSYRLELSAARELLIQRTPGLRIRNRYRLNIGRRQLHNSGRIAAWVDNHLGNRLAPRQRETDRESRGELGLGLHMLGRQHLGLIALTEDRQSVGGHAQDDPLRTITLLEEGSTCYPCSVPALDVLGRTMCVLAELVQRPALGIAVPNLHVRAGHGAWVVLGRGIHVYARVYGNSTRVRHWDGAIYRTARGTRAPAATGAAAAARVSRDGDARAVLNLRAGTALNHRVVRDRPSCRAASCYGKQRQTCEQTYFRGIPGKSYATPRPEVSRVSCLVSSRRLSPTEWFSCTSTSFILGIPLFAAVPVAFTLRHMQSTHVARSTESNEQYPGARTPSNAFR
jgi:hypothetical protein